MKTREHKEHWVFQSQLFVPNPDTWHASEWTSGWCHPSVFQPRAGPSDSWRKQTHRCCCCFQPLHLGMQEITGTVDYWWSNTFKVFARLFHKMNFLSFSVLDFFICFVIWLTVSFWVRYWRFVCFSLLPRLNPSLSASFTVVPIWVLFPMTPGPQ